MHFRSHFAGDFHRGFLRLSRAVRDTGAMRARRVGRDGLLVECASVTEVAGAYAALRAQEAQLLAIDIVPAARTVLLDGLADREAALELVAALTPARVDGPTTDVAEVEVPVHYDGPDLEEVARQWQVTSAVSS